MGSITVLGASIVSSVQSVDCILRWSRVCILKKLLVCSGQKRSPHCNLCRRGADRRFVYLSICMFPQVPVCLSSLSHHMSFFKFPPNFLPAASLLLEMGRWLLLQLPAHFARRTDHHHHPFCWSAGCVSRPQGALWHSTQNFQHEHNGEHCILL